MTDENKTDDVVEYETWVEDAATTTDAPDAPDTLVVEDAETRSNSRWPFVLLLGALLGFGASFAANYLTRPAPYDPAPLRGEIDALRTELAALRDRPVPETQAVDLRPLERRVRALETAPAPDAAAPVDEALVERLEALQADGLAVPPVDLEPLEARIRALEERSTAAPPPVTQPTDTDAPLPSFPAQALRDGVEARSGGLFSKHIRVRREDDPLTLIEGIEADMAARRPAAAIAKFDRLPSELRSLARGWRADMDSHLR